MLVESLDKFRDLELGGTHSRREAAPTLSHRPFRLVSPSPELFLLAGFPILVCLVGENAQ
jgi:hypothetical protein